MIKYSLKRFERYATIIQIGKEENTIKTVSNIICNILWLVFKGALKALVWFLCLPLHIANFVMFLRNKRITNRRKKNYA